MIYFIANTHFYHARGNFNEFIRDKEDFKRINGVLVDTETLKSLQNKSTKNTEEER